MQSTLHRRTAAGVVAVCFAAGVARSQNVTQSFTLQPGWNAIYLEVRPADNSTATIFSNLPVATILQVDVQVENLHHDDQFHRRWRLSPPLDTSRERG